jgi:hypothetical protein
MAMPSVERRKKRLKPASRTTASETPRSWFGETLTGPSASELAAKSGGNEKLPAPRGEVEEAVDEAPEADGHHDDRDGRRADHRPQKGALDEEADEKGARRAERGREREGETRARA